MSAIFGSQGYRPDTAGVKGMNNALVSGLGGLDQFNTTGGDRYYRNGKEISKGVYDYYNKTNNRGGLSVESTPVGPSQYQQSLPNFNYKPGESGYGFTDAANTAAANSRAAYRPQGYSQYQYNTPDLQNQADQYYSGVENNAINSAMRGSRAGMDQAASALGRRGITNSGIADQAMGQLGGQLSRDLSGISSDIGFQRARDLTDVAKTQGGWDLQRQGMQANENQFGANLGQRQTEYGSGLEQQIGNQMLQALQGQYGADTGLRNQQMGFARLPYEDLLKMYGLNLGAAGQSQPGLLGNLMGSAGSLASGIGTLGTGFGWGK